MLFIRGRDRPQPQHRQHIARLARHADHMCAENFRGIPLGDLMQDLERIDRFRRIFGQRDVVERELVEAGLEQLTTLRLGQCFRCQACS